MIALLALGVGIGVWRFANPPIDERLAEQLARAQAYERQCDFYQAFYAYRQALTLDGSNVRAMRGVKRNRSIVRSLEVGMLVPGCNGMISDESANDIE